MSEPDGTPSPDPFVPTVDFAAADAPGLHAATIERAPPPSEAFADTIDAPSSRFAGFPPGTQFGDYVLLEELARGGMGVVFRARQVSLNRTVALKMILAGRLASPEQVRRFRAEAEEAARLDHPNIVPIYQIDEIAGQHFFSMKLIDGGSLSARIEELAGAPREAARVVAAAARAVAHAHAGGVLHRDLKPGNILLDSRGEPHVTDFGLVKHFGGDETHSGAVVGTPSYMPPEQALGQSDLTPAADVYGLGAVLYECLTGRPPFMGPTPADTLLQVIDRDPDRPSAHNPRVPRDLETICLKCLHKSPERRYASADELAADLDRFLAGEPIVARPVGFVERAAKWVRRRPTRAALVAVSTTAAAALLIGGWWYNLQLQSALQDAKTARDQADRARGLAVTHADDADRQRKEAERQQKEAEANFERTRDTVDALHTRVVEGRLSRMAGSELVRIEFLQETAELYRKFMKERKQDAAVRRGAGIAFQRLAYGRRLAKQYPGARDDYAEALAVQTALASEFPGDPVYARDLATTHRQIGDNFRFLKEYTQAEAAYRESIRLAEAVTPQTVSDRRDAAVGYNELANTLVFLTRNDDAEAAYRTSVERYERILAENEKDGRSASDLCKTATNLGRHLTRTNHPDDAMPVVLRALAAGRQALAADPDLPAYRATLVDAYFRTADAMKSVRNADGLARLSAELVRDFPNDATQRYNAACLLASAADASRPAVGPPSPAELAASDGLAKRAVAQLRQAVEAGFKNGAQVARDPDLDPVRRRADFVAVADDLARRAPDQALTPEREFYALLGEYQTATRTYSEAIQKAKTPAEQAEVVARAPRPSDYADRFLDLAERAPEAATAVEACVWVLTNIRPEVAGAPARRARAVAAVTKSHLHSDKMLQVARLFYDKPDEAGRKLLQAIADASPHRDVQANALLPVALHLKAECEKARAAKDPAADSLEAQAAELLDRLAKDYPGVKRAGFVSLVSDLARTEHFELTRLAIGKRVPDIVGVDLDGKPLKLSDYKGKVVIIDFWADWCGFCRVMYPQQKELVEKMKGRPFALLGVNADDDPAEARAAVERDKLTWRSWMDGGDSKRKICREWNVNAYPRFFVIDAEGIIRARQTGTHKDIASLVEPLVKEAEAAAAGRGPGN